MAVKAAAIVAVAVMTASAQNMPFPQQKSYTGCIKPSIEQNTMNQTIKSVYDSYISTYLADFGGGYIIKSTSTNQSGSTATVSEAHGWGMVITAIMAGHDSNAKKYFDGMLKVYENNRNWGPGSNLMAWKLYWGGTNDGQSNATDGDLDIAYALLLAYKQWGDVAYYNKAKAIVNDIKAYNINSSRKHTLLGNWAISTLPDYTRPSDWMGGHFRTFATAFNDNSWNDFANNIYTIYSNFQKNSYSTVGLISDFVYNTGSAANSTESSALTQHGEKNQTKYATNAARVPWRMAADFALSQNSGAKAALDKINTFLNSQTLSSSGIKEGYHLDGTPLNSNAGGATFLAPFVAARIASANQSSLTQGWNSLVSTATSDAYQTAIKLQSMLLISGNWWHYNDANTVGNEPTFETAGVILDDFGDVDAQSDLEHAFGIEKHGDANSWKGGYGWMVEDWQTGKVKTSKGAVWQAPVYDANDKLTNPGNLSDVFIDGHMKLQFDSSSALYVNFPLTVDKQETQWFDLSAMSGLTIKAKGTGKLTIVFNTDNTGTLSDPKNSFWGGYATTISLDGSEKEYQLIADLFSARPYSEEAKNLWTWKTNGSKKVRGITLLAEDAATAEIDFIKINGANIKNETFGFKTPVVVDPIVGENVAKLGVWNVYADKASKGTAVINGNGVDMTFDRAAPSSAGAWDKYVSVVGAFNTATKNFEGMKSVEFLYTSDQDIAVTLPMADDKGVAITGDAVPAHVVILPKGTNKRMTFTTDKFLQPGWWTEKNTALPLDLKQVDGLSFSMETATDAATKGTFNLTELKIDGIKILPTSIASVNGVAKTAGFGAISLETGMVRTNLTLPRAAEMTLSVVNMQGRVVATMNKQLSAGANTVSLNLGSQANGVYFLVAKGAAGTFQQKISVR